MKYQRKLENQNNSNGSKLINVLMTIYMATVLIFTYYPSLNVISQFFFVMAFGGCALYMLMHNNNFRFDPFIMWFFAFIMFCFIGLAWAQNVNSSISMIITLVQLLVLSVLLFSYISNYNNVNVFIFGLLISGLICSYIVIGYYGLGDYIRLMSQGQRLGGMISNLNTIGMYTSITVIIAFYYAYFKGKRFCYVVMLLPLLVTFGTGSRTALAMCVLGVGLLIFMQYREDISITGFMKLLIVIAVFFLILNLMSTMPIFEGVFSRIENVFGGETGQRDGSTESRQEMIRYGWEYFKQHPYTGAGIGNSHIITKEYLGRSTYLHNNFIELLASVGIVGFIVFYGMYFYLLKNLYSLSIVSKNTTATLMFTIILSHLVAEYGMVSYYNKMTYILFAMAAATISIGKRQLKEKEMSFEETEEREEDAYDPSI